MNNTFIIASLLLLLSITQVKAQINADSISQYNATAEGRKNYSLLKQRLVQVDSNLTRNDFYTLYYGASAQSSYQLKIIDTLEQQIKDHNILQEFILAYELADSLLSFHPASITAYFEKSFSCYALKRNEEESINNQKYQIFIKCVLNSGDGSTESPYIVLSKNDAIEVVKFLQLKYKGIDTENNNAFAVYLQKKRQGSDKLYFRLAHDFSGRK
jgi:hypothetical protein